MGSIRAIIRVILKAPAEFEGQLNFSHSVGHNDGDTAGSANLTKDAVDSGGALPALGSTAIRVKASARPKYVIRFRHCSSA
jgi:hypothetical protein